MTRNKTVMAAAIVALMGLSARAETPQETQQQLSDEIAALKSRVAQLEAQQHASTDAAAKSTADAVLTDAERRSTLLGSDMSIGYTGGKLLIQTADKNFSLHPWFQLQVRDITNYRQDSKHGGADDDLQNGFEIRRMKFGFDGNLITPDLTYLFIWATDRHDGIPKLEEAWAKYKFTDSPWAIKAGQLKDPLDHEQIVSSKYQMTVERSLVTDIFANGDAFVQGVSAIYDAGGPVRAEAAFTDGLKSANTNFQDYPSVTAGNSPPADWGTAGRVEYKLFGTWKDYDHFSTIGNAEDMLVFGGGADYTEAGDTDSLVHVVDAYYARPNGFGAYAAYLGRYTRNNTAGPASADTYDWTLRGLLSYAIDRNWEPFVRYDFIRFDSAGVAAGAENEVHEFTVGTNYYLHGQAAKLTLEGSYLPNGSPVADDSSGVLADQGGDQFVLRAQFQLLF